MQRINHIRRKSLQLHYKRAVEDNLTVGREKRGVADFLPFWVLYSASSGSCGNLTSELQKFTELYTCFSATNSHTALEQTSSGDKDEVA